MSNEARVQLSVNGRRLELGVITTLTVDGVPTESEILDLCNCLRALPIYAVSDSEFNEVIKLSLIHK